MALFIVLGVVVLTTFFVLGFLFFTLDQEGQKEKEKVVPLRDVLQLRQEVSDAPAEPQIPKAVDEPAAPKYLATEDVYKKRAQELEEELLAVSKKAQDELARARQTIEDLTKDNEALKDKQSDLIQAQQKIVELQKETDHLHTENSTLQAQLDSSVVQVRFLEQELATVKAQMGDQIAQANAMVSELNLQKESWVSAAKPDPQAERLNQELEALKQEQIQLKQNGEALEVTNQKLREINTHLTKEIDALQYELIKARAQSTGLDEARPLAGFFARDGGLAVEMAHYFSQFSLILSYLYDPDGIFETNVRRCTKAQFIVGPHRPDERAGIHAIPLGSIKKN